MCRKKDGQDIKSNDNNIIEVKEKGRIKKALTWFWSYREMRSMIGACVVIYFASLMLTSKIEIKMAHDVNGNIRINHDFSGNMHKPINLQISDPGYPIKVDVKNK
ncbi:MAG: hypothetical protein RSB82_04880 [Victivallaceae bacterium]